MRGLILIPYYFVGALAAMPLLLVASRMLRLTVAINTLTLGALAFTVVAIALPLAVGWLELRQFTAWPLAAIILLSFVLAALDSLLARVLPLPLDQELREL